MQPVEEILERWGPLLPLLHDAEVCPKTLCQADRDSNLVDNDVDAFRAALIERAGLGAGDPLAAVAELLGRVDVDSAGVCLIALLNARLRFEDLENGDRAMVIAFERDPAALVARFRADHRAVPPTAFHPANDARLFRTFHPHE